MSQTIPYRLGLQQRVFPAYRAPFFDALAGACAGGLSVFSGEPMPDEALGKPGRLQRAQHVQAHNLYLGGGALLFVWQRKLLDWLEHWHPDVLVMDTNPRNVSTNAALRWMHARGGPVIGWGLGAPPLRGPLGGAFEQSRRQFLGQFDAIISYSQTGAQQFLRCGVPEERVFIAPNAATPRPEQPLAERPAAYRDGRPVVLFVGRLQARKRVDALLQACAGLPEALQPRVVIVGDGPAREDFESAAQAVYPRDRYPGAEFAGARHDAELAPFFAAADLFVLPGTGGLAVQQAMSYGLPVMVAEADGTQSDLVRVGNGWVLPPNDNAALRERLEEALGDVGRLRRMGEESYRIVKDEVNLERMVEVFAEVVGVVMRKRRK